MYNRKKAKKPVPTDPDEAFAKALRTAFNILGYKDNTEYQLKEKLNERGYNEQTVDAVCSYMIEKGFMNDERMLYRLVRSLADSRLYGRARIMQEIRRRRFSSDVLDRFSFDNEELEDVDFVSNCLKLIKKKGGMRDERTYAALVRYGHSPSDIREAYKRLQNENEEQK
jgi:regulatory protein